jgi:hypothetical protein
LPTSFNHVSRWPNSLRDGLQPRHSRSRPRLRVRTVCQPHTTSLTPSVLRTILRVLLLLPRPRSPALVLPRLRLRLRRELPLSGGILGHLGFFDAFAPPSFSSLSPSSSSVVVLVVPRTRPRPPMMLLFLLVSLFSFPIIRRPSSLVRFRKSHLVRVGIYIAKSARECSFIFLGRKTTASFWVMLVFSCTDKII